MKNIDISSVLHDFNIFITVFVVRDIAFGLYLYGYIAECNR